MSWVFNGSTSLVEIDDHTSLTLPQGDWAIAFLYKTPTTPVDAHQFYLAWGVFPATSTFSVVWVRTNDTLKVNTQTSGDFQSSVESAADKQSVNSDIHSVVAQRSSNTLYLYLDNVELGSTAVEPTGGTINSTSKFRIGQGGAVSSEVYFTGEIQHIAKWDAALTSGQRAALATSPPGTGSPTPVWHCPAIDDYDEDVAGLTTTPTNMSLGADFLASTSTLPLLAYATQHRRRSLS